MKLRPRMNRGRRSPGHTAKKADRMPAMPEDDDSNDDDSDDDGDHGQAEGLLEQGEKEWLVRYSHVILFVAALIIPTHKSTHGNKVISPAHFINFALHIYFLQSAQWAHVNRHWTWLAWVSGMLWLMTVLSNLL